MANGDQMDDVAEARLARTHLLGVPFDLLDRSCSWNK